MTTNYTTLQTSMVQSYLTLIDLGAVIFFSGLLWIAIKELW